MRFGRRRDSEADASPTFRVESSPDAELGHFRHPPYSMWGAMRYILVLSIVLWWLPTFGQMIAGYVGGRRAGGPWRGTVAAILPVVIILGIASGAERGMYSPWLGAIAAVPAGVGTLVSAVIPPATPYVQFVLDYLRTFVDGLGASLAMGPNGYLVTVVFAYIGGILADQTRREAVVGRGTSVGISISQPLLATLRNPYSSWEAPQPARFEEMRRIPVGYARVAPALRARPPKIDARRGDVGGQEGPGPHRETHARDAKARFEPRQESKPDTKPEHKGLDPHEREIATRKWVERALRQYETAHKR